MPGTINWTITYQGAGPQPVVELFNVSTSEDVEPQVIDVPCEPPIACPWPTENLGFGNYKAAIRSGSNRYYYVQGVDPITAPNNPGDGTVVTLSQGNPTASVKIRVQV